jgi:hypothetical protein
MLKLNDNFNIRQIDTDGKTLTYENLFVVLQSIQQSIRYMLT